jgi:GntR family transcriptional regulator
LDAQRRERVREPLYSVIASQAEVRILSGQWAPGTRLPPERDLCRELEVSRATLRQALAELEDRGLITRHQGRGTFVTRSRVQTPLSGTFSLREALAARGSMVVTRVIGIEMVDASRQLASELACLPGDSLLHLERLRLVDGEPMVLESSHLPMELFPGLEAADFSRRSLYDILREDFGRSVAEAQETIEPVILTPHESALLGVARHTPAVLTRRITTDTTGRVVELGQALLRGDRSRYLLIRRVAEVTADGTSLPPSVAVDPPGILATVEASLDTPTVARQLAPHSRHRAPSTRRNARRTPRS